MLEATNPTTEGHIHMDVASDHLQDRSRGHQIPQNHTVSYRIFLQCSTMLQCEIERPRRTREMGIDLGLLGHLGRERFAEQTFGATATEAPKQLKPPPGVVLICLDHFKTNKPSWPKCQRKDGHLLFLFGFRSVLEKEALQTVSITELFHSICLQP